MPGSGDIVMNKTHPHLTLDFPKYIYYPHCQGQKDEIEIYSLLSNHVYK